MVKLDFNVEYPTRQGQTRRVALTSTAEPPTTPHAKTGTNRAHLVAAALALPTIEQLMKLLS